MKNFREAYKNMVDCIPVPDMKPEQLLDEAHRKKVVSYKRHRKFVAAASAACVFLLCSAGVAAAAGYARSIIKVDEKGFQTADAATARMNGWDAAAGGTEGYDAGGNTTVTDSAPQEGAAPETEQSKRATEEGTEEMQVMQGAAAEKEMLDETPISLPDRALLGEEILSEEYEDSGDFFLMVRIKTDKGWFMLNQAYYGDTAGHSSSTVYYDGVCNERSYTTGQGYTYTVVDSNSAEGEIPDIHAAISVWDYELIVDFIGYTEEEAYAILETMDLSIYQ